MQRTREKSVARGAFVLIVALCAGQAGHAAQAQAPQPPPSAAGDVNQGSEPAWPDSLPENCVEHTLLLPLLTRDGSPAVPVDIEGEHGAAFIGITQGTTGVFEFKDKLRSHDDGVQVQTVTGVTSAHYTHIDTLQLGRGQAHNMVVLDMGGGTLPKVAGTRVLGVIGYDIMGNYNVLIDMPHQRLALFKETGAAGCAPMAQWLGEGSFKTPLYLSATGERDLVQLSLGGVPVGVELEPGSNASILRLEDAKSTGLDEARLAQDPRIRTQASSTLIGWRHHFGPFSLGNWHGSGMDVDIETARYNLLGLGFFRDRTVLVAFPTGMLYFSPEVAVVRPAGASRVSDSPTRSRLADTTVGEDGAAP